MFVCLDEVERLTFVCWCFVRVIQDAGDAQVEVLQPSQRLELAEPSLNTPFYEHYLHGVKVCGREGEREREGEIGRAFMH